MQRRSGVTSINVHSTLVSKGGSQYAADKLIDHAVSKVHLQLLAINMNKDIKQFLRHTPSTDPNRLTNNKILQMTVKSHETYKLNVRHVATVFNDMKTVTPTQRTFPARNLVRFYTQHVVSLADGPFTPYVPVSAHLRYNNRARHSEIKALISSDVTEHYVKPHFQPITKGGAVAFGVTYDGWRAFVELFIHACRLVLRTGESMFFFVGLIKPTDGGAHGCVGSFIKAYGAMFKNGMLTLSLTSRLTSYFYFALTKALVVLWIRQLGLISYRGSYRKPQIKPV